MVGGSWYQLNLDFLNDAYDEWTKVFPTIRPYYAVKCNPHPLIIDRLAKLGAGFDCASLAEIELVMSLGIPETDILYANPCKRPCDIPVARQLGIKVTTFDSVCELEKIVRWAPDMDVILRIRSDDLTAKCQLGNKYGAEEELWPVLFDAVRSFGLNLVGISFHVGSGARSNQAYIEGAKKARKAVNISRCYGFNPTLIDIGGGFTYGKIVPDIIDHLQGFEVIAEPGRYFAEHVATLYTPVIGYKDDSVTIDESLYGAFNCRIFDHADPLPVFDTKEPKSQKTLFGCTCDGFDIIYNNIELPELQVGDIIEWPRMGAYTMAATTAFNGIPFNNREIKI
jgi:ornithine decarboxylase